MKLTFLSSIVAAFLATSAAAIPLNKRAEMCGQWDTTSAGPYTVYNNLWGEGSATSGSQCTSVNSIDGNVLSWSTSWSWAGGQYNVKSYANAELKFDAVKLSSVSSIPFQWSWSYSGSNIVADVAFDLWTSTANTSDFEIEIMVWLAAIGGAGPIGDSVGTFSYGGYTWNLHKGNNGSNDVYSFVATEQIKSIKSDLLPFFKHLIDSGYISSSQYLRAVQAGTEPFLGSNAKLVTSSYSVSVN
uniref:Xyloglucanase B n=1 Tax=Rhizomucor miehei TaxID=4839 RepID=M9PK16_RHIMI|nr:xyloglucanase B [Rhizomucor miehei]